MASGTNMDVVFRHLEWTTLRNELKMFNWWFIVNMKIEYLMWILYLVEILSKYKLN